MSLVSSTPRPMKWSCIPNEAIIWDKLGNCCNTIKPKIKKEANKNCQIKATIWLSDNVEVNIPIEE
jgi:hypothetical protein